MQFAIVGALVCLAAAANARVAGIQKVKAEGVTCPEDINDFLLPNPSDCGSFFYCSNLTPYLMDCPAGLHFNTDLDV